MTPRTWLPDPSHYPEQLTPLSATVWFEAIGRGLHEAMRKLGGPFGGFEARTQLGWAYEGELDPEWELEDGALVRAGLALPDLWERELAPRAHEITSALHHMRPERPVPDAAASLFQQMWALVLEQWTIHFLAVIPAQAVAELAHDLYRQEVGGHDALAPYRLLEGPNESTEADTLLRRLADRAVELDVADVLTEYPADLATERLRQLHQGRRFLHDVDAYLARFGGRARLHELSLPREAERPEMTIHSLRLFLRSLGTVRAQPPRPAPAPPGAARLAEILPAARFGHALKESHVYHIDYPGLLATREVLLGFGRRLLAEGLLRNIDDLWMLRRTELEAALKTEPEEPLWELAERRRTELADGRARGPEQFLGEPPQHGERNPMLEKFYGRGGSTAAHGILRGSGASPGQAEGRARIVRGTPVFSRIQPGDVLVATTTTPAWTPLFPSLAALVTETGGILSHAAIVAREYGIPAVVAAAGATDFVPDGARIRVDGTYGSVELIDSNI
jgi:phosphohistidine swiveling domain-containing protein